MNEQEFNRITDEVKRLGLFGIRTEKTSEGMLITIPEGQIMGYQVNKLQELTKGYALSIQAKIQGLLITIW
ncbi:hypothetical protein [Spirosoma sp.]|uniref:hypothetical protein n=1 Tax=Spirosoma sp. TaxID=1899569 RepID=UPI002615604E|nr:hypothetical protein [Spirosoma sp.]MCX6216590.1 hypothetical protein [Spirosoma sp.]